MPIEAVLFLLICIASVTFAFLSGYLFGYKKGVKEMTEYVVHNYLLKAKESEEE
jgi:hypothetical protein